MPALEMGVAAEECAIGVEVVVVVEMALELDAATDSELRLDVGGAFVTRGVGTRGGAVAPVVMTLLYYAISYIMKMKMCYLMRSRTGAWADCCDVVELIEDSRFSQGCGKVQLS